MSATLSRADNVDNEGPRNADHSGEGSVGYQRLLLPDPIAFKLLREDACAKSIDPQATIVGYELYIVEQWACSRTQPTSVITTFTGLPQHSVLVGVLGIPVEEEKWSETLKSYIEAAKVSHARLKKIDAGILMVTNLSSFPSNLTVIPVPDGDLDSNRESFIVNEGLKRFGCSGRSGLTLTNPSSAIATKFVQQYHVHDSVAISEAVISLVKLCQSALIIFDVLSPIYRDGLLCDMTESAINRWWTKFGTDYYSVEPSDGILGPTTVSALLGLYMGARNRLNSCGGPTVKDAFDTLAMERSISYYQRSQKLSGTRGGRLDRQTLDSLHRSTSKAANNERWLVPRAVKSTVAEFGGKGGEMVMGMVGRDKAGIADIETLDISRFAQVVSGRHARRVWQGHTKKPDSVDIFGAARDDEQIPGLEDMSRDLKAARKRTTDLSQKLKNSATDQFYSITQHGSQSSLEGTDKEAASRKNVLRSVTGRMNEARSGIGRFKDAVGRTALRGGYPHGALPESIKAPTKRAVEPAKGEGSQLQKLPQRPREAPDEQDSNMVNTKYPRASNLATTETVEKSSNGPDAQAEWSIGEDKLERTSSNTGRPAQKRSPHGNVRHKVTENGAKSRVDATSGSWHERQSHKLRPTQSLQSLDGEATGTIEAFRSTLPRQMSASGVDGIYDLGYATQERLQEEDADPQTAKAKEQVASARNVRLARSINELKDNIQPYIERRLEELGALSLQLEQERSNIEYEYAGRINEHKILQEGTNDLLQEEEAFLTDTVRELEVLGARLEYEMSALVSKVEDIEDGVIDFEHQVKDLETRLETLEAAEERSSLWPMRILGL